MMHRRRRQLDDEPVPARLDQRARGLDGAAASAVVELDPLPAQLELAARDARDVEQVVEQPRHVIDLAVDHVAAPTSTAPRSRAAVLLIVRRVADRRERIAQLVRQRRQELVLAAIGRPQAHPRRACGR